MKNLPKIIKGDIPLTINFALEHGGLMITPIEAEKFHIMLESVFNAGKNGIVDPEIEADFDQFYSVLYPNRKARPKALKAYIKARAKVSKEIIHDAVTKQRPEMLKIMKENKVKGDPPGKHVLHPTTWLNDEHWDDEVETYTPTVREEIKAKPILTVDVIMGSKQGQYALEKGVGAHLLDFVRSDNEYPTEDEFRDLYSNAQKPPKDNVEVVCRGIMRRREFDLKDKYWKDK